MATAAPAICDTCGAVFPSGFAFEGGGLAYLYGNTSGPCPHCGGMGSVPDGLYELVEGTLKIFSTWSPERRQRLAADIAAAKTRTDSRAAAEAVISRDSDLLELANRLLIPKSAGEFWAFVAAILAALALLSSDDHTTVTEQTVIEQIVREAPTPPPPPSKGSAGRQRNQPKPKARKRPPKTYGKHKKRRKK